MDELDFNNYFDKDKAEIKFLLTETQIRIEECQQKLLLNKDNKNMQNKLSYEQERYRALKLSLIACDDNSILSTVNFEEYGTLDVNKVYGKLAKKFKFDFKIHPPGSSSARNPSPIQKKSHLIRPVVYDFSEVFKKK